MNAAYVAIGFLHSDEFLNANVSNEKYLKILYKTILDRDPDDAGYQDWLGKLNAGYSRDYILRGFIYASEFAGLCEAYGVEHGELNLSN